MELPDPASVTTEYRWERGKGPITEALTLSTTGAGQKIQVEYANVTEYGDGSEPTVTARGQQLKADGTPDKRTSYLGLARYAFGQEVLAEHLARKYRT